MHVLLVLYKLHLLTPIGLYRVVTSIFRYGINLKALISIASKAHGDRIAIVDDHRSLTYTELYEQTDQLSKALARLQLRRGHKVALICRNHATLVQLICALSGLGIDIYLINVEMGRGQLEKLLQGHRFDGWIFDDDLHETFTSFPFAMGGTIHRMDQWPIIQFWIHQDVALSSPLQNSSKGRIVLLTGGTTGKSKSIIHRPSLFSYLQPFLAFTTLLKVPQYRTAYIATPIYHGYGVATLLIFILFGMKIVLTHKFTANTACQRIRDHQVEVITVVPLMIAKMLQHNIDALRSLRCIAAGGAELNPKLAMEVRRKLGDVLYNLYGTTETGLCTIATPKDLSYSLRTIGKPIRGNRVEIVDEEDRIVPVGKVGQLSVKNRWSMANRTTRWIHTGDLGYRDENGYFFLCGRVDDMIVSAGENVYPLEVEQVIVQHPAVRDVAVIGVPDEHFGQRLIAIVVMKEGAYTTEDEMLQWLKGRIARYQMPREIRFVDRMPYTTLGKLDKKKLRKMQGESKL